MRALGHVYPDVVELRRTDLTAEHERASAQCIVLVTSHFLTIEVSHHASAQRFDLYVHPLQCRRRMSRSLAHEPPRQLPSWPSHEEPRLVPRRIPTRVHAEHVVPPLHFADAEADFGNPHAISTRVILDGEVRQLDRRRQVRLIDNELPVSLGLAPERGGLGHIVLKDELQLRSAGLGPWAGNG